MKRLVFFLLALALAVSTFAVTAIADEAGKTVDGNMDRWEQESTRADTLATMTWNQAEDSLHFIGEGYADRPGLKFGFRSSVAYANTDVAVKIKFPETFSAYYGGNNNMHFAIAYTNNWKTWWNSSDNITKAVAFIVRPLDDNTVTVQLAGRWAAGPTGYGDVSTVEVVEYQIPADRVVEFGFVKGGDGLITAMVNGTEHGKLDKPLTDGKTMSDNISDFYEGKGYLEFGATLENDPSGIALEYTIVETRGALDAFKAPVTPPAEDIPPISQEGAGIAQEGGKAFNWNYVILYGISGALGIGALVCFILSKLAKR